MSLHGCRTCSQDVAEDAPMCPHCGAPRPAGTRDSDNAWKDLGPSFDRLVGSIFVGLLLFSLIPLVLGIAGTACWGAIVGAMG